MQLNQATDYAFRVILYLASLPENDIANSNTIAEQQNIPTGFLQKILRALTKGNLVKSYRGIDGGFMLARPAAEITLLDVITVMEGPIELQRCLLAHDACSRGCAPKCPVHTALAVIQSDLTHALSSVTFASMIE